MTEPIVNELTEASALDAMHELIDMCDGDPNMSIIMIVANSETGNVKVCGANIDEMEVPILLTETAAELGHQVLEQLNNRTIN